MKKTALFLMFAACFAALLFENCPAPAKDKKPPKIEAIGSSIYIDGEKFFIKGVGYSPFRPGKYPGSQVSPEIIEADFRKIKQAGFNTLRVWGIMPEDQLELAEKYDLKVIQAAGLRSDADFGYSGFARLAEAQVRRMCRISKGHPNVIMYLVMNEPHSKAVLDSGVDDTLNLYKRLADIIREEDPGRPVSMANAYWTSWLDQSMWDVVSFNTYSYSSGVADIGYANMIKNLRAIHSKNKPFVVTEFGLSVSPDGNGKGGYGGNTEKEQAECLVNYFRELIRGGAAGGCVFEWNDEWWKAGNALIHDGHAEEWFGIVGITDRNDPKGTPRKAYYSMQEEFKLVVTKPADGYRMLDSAEIEVSASPVIKNLRYRIDGGEWTDLFAQGGWWRGSIDGLRIEPGLHRLTIQGREGEKAVERTLDLIKCKSKEELLPPVNIELSTGKSGYENGDIIEINARLTDRKGIPLKNRNVKLGILDTTDSRARSWEGETNSEGFFSKATPAIGKSDAWYYLYWAGTETEEYGYKSREGKVDYFKAEIGEGFPIRWLLAKKGKDIKIDGVTEEAWLETSGIIIDDSANFMEGDIEGSKDLSAEIRALWDDNNIYILASVKDDIPMKNAYEKYDLWKGDCIELFISVDPEKIPEKGYSSSDFQILIGANGGMWVTGQANGGTRNNVPTLSYAAAKKTPEGYTLEAKVNIANFWDKPFRVLEKDDIMGFDIAVADADESGMRDAKLIWNGTAGGYKDSAVWGRMKLE